MKKFMLLLIIVAVAGLIAAGPAMRHINDLNAPHFQTADVSEGTITTIVRAVGTVEPVLSVQVGSFVSGPIEALYVDFNDSVKKGQLLAKIDPRILAAEVARDRAALATTQAEVQRVTALVQQARNDEGRGVALRNDNKNFLSDSEMDKLKFGRLSLEAQLAVAQAGVQQADAKLNTSLANLGYAEIRSPVDGIIIDRRVEPGQTVAASFTTPVLFVVTPDLAGEMHIFAKVDEADIGLVREAQQADRPVRFTVDAYPDDQFYGRVKQIRSSSTIIERVVTFPVVVSTTNPEKKLLPGMTASLHFETAVKENVRRVPNAAISFFPTAEQVRGEDRMLLAPGEPFQKQGDVAAVEEEGSLSRRRNRRHVWIVDGRLLRAVPITVGISDDAFTEIVSGDLKGRANVVTGIGT